MNGGGAGGRPRVLVIEDDDAVADILRLVLTDLGCDVRLVRHPRDADPGLAPDLVLSDVIAALPRTSGTTRRFAQGLRLRFRDVPVVLLTADSAILRDGLDLPVDLVLGKPFDIVDLGDRVQALLDAERAAYPAARSAKGGRDSVTAP